MADFRIIIEEFERSGFVTIQNAQNGAFVIKAKKGPKLKPIFCQSEEDYILYFGRPDVNTVGGFEAIQFLRVSPGWVVSAVGNNSYYAGLDVLASSVRTFGPRAGRDIDNINLSTLTQEITGESLGTGNGITDTFLGTLTVTSGITEGSLILKRGGVDQGITDAAGAITGTALDSGSISYSSGAWALDFAGTPGVAAQVTTDVDLSSPIDLSSGNTAGIAEISSTTTQFVGTIVPAITTNTYDLDVTIDGGGLNQISFTINVADDWDTIAASIQSALRTATGSTETVIVTAGRLRITSATNGASSTVLIAAGTAASGGGDLLAFIDANVAGMTTTLETPVPGTNNDKSCLISIDGTTNTVNFGSNSSTSQATVISTINSAFTGTPASASGNFVQIDGSIGDAANGQIIIANPASGSSALTALFSTGGTTISSTDVGQTASTNPTGSIPTNGQTITLDYLYTSDQSALISHSFYAFSPYNDTDFQIQVDITSVTSSSVPTGTFQMVLSEVNGLIESETLQYNLTAGTKDGFGRSLYIFDVFRNHPHIVPIINSSYTGATPSLTSNPTLFSGGDRGDEPASGDYTAGWQLFRKKNNYPVKIFMDVLGNGIQDVLDLVTNYQKYAFGISIVPFGQSSYTDAISYRQGLSIDNDNLALYSNHALIQDIYNDSRVWTSQVGKIGVKYAQMEDVFDGLSPAGSDENNHGGQLSGFQVYELEEDYTDDEKRLLDESQVNPIIFDDQLGVIVDGDRTLQVQLTDSSYIGHRRLFNLIIDTVIKQVLKQQKFKNNDVQHRDVARQLTQNILSPILARDLLQEAIPICNTTNNTAVVLSRREFVLDIVVKVTPNSQRVKLRFTRLSQTDSVADFVPLEA